VLDQFTVFEAVHKLPDRSFELNSCPGSGKMRLLPDTAAADVVAPSCREEGDSADCTMRGFDGWAPGQAVFTDVDRSGFGNEHLAGMAERREDDIGNGRKKLGPGTGDR
jgi:hypothetical protein